MVPKVHLYSKMSSDNCRVGPVISSTILLLYSMHIKKIKNRHHASENKHSSAFKTMCTLSLINRWRSLHIAHRAWDSAPITYVAYFLLLPRYFPRFPGCLHPPIGKFCGISDFKNIQVWWCHVCHRSHQCEEHIIYFMTFACKKNIILLNYFRCVLHCTVVKRITSMFNMNMII